MNWVNANHPLHHRYLPCQWTHMKAIPLYLRHNECFLVRLSNHATLLIFCCSKTKASCPKFKGFSRILTMIMLQCCLKLLRMTYSCSKPRATQALLFTHLIPCSGLIEANTFQGTFLWLHRIGLRRYTGEKNLSKINRLEHFIRKTVGKKYKFDPMYLIKS